MARHSPRARGPGPCWRPGPAKRLAVLSIVLPAVAALGASPLDAGSAQEPASVRVDAPAPVVFVVFDELPLASLMGGDGDIDEDRFPNFARLADHATWFRNTATSHAYTGRAVPALLTGSAIADSPRPVFDEHPTNLFTLLSEDYRIWAREYATELCPTDLCESTARTAASRQRWRRLLADTGLRSLYALLPEPLTGGSGREGERASYDEFLAAVVTAEEPTLHYYHSLLPHFPWQRLPSGESYTQSDETPGLLPTEGRMWKWRGEDWPVAHGWQRHLLQVGRADARLGALLDRLQGAGVYDEALLVVTSDHGMSFRPGTLIRTTVDENVAEVAFVPLFIKRPGQRTPAVVDEPAQLIDVLPTVLDVLDAGSTPPFEGRSLFDRATGRTDRIIESGFGERIAVPDDLGGVEETVARRLELFGERGWRHVYHFGPRNDLLGLPGWMLAPLRRPSVRVELEEGDRFTEVDPGTTEFPGLLVGDLVADAELSDPVDYAVTVNGRVAATGRSFRQEGPRAKVRALVPPTAFLPGYNHVEVVPLDGERGSGGA